MQKIVRRVINHKYLPFKIDILVEGRIPFDCYIKRYDDYVIIIEAGSNLTYEFLEKIRHNKTFYISVHDSLKMKEYRTEHAAAHEVLEHASAIKSVSELSKTLIDIGETEKRLNHIYTVVSNLMEHIFDSVDEHLPIEVLDTAVMHIVEMVQSDERVMGLLMDIVPDEYTTHNHSTNVAFFSAVLGSVLNLSKDEILCLTYAGLLHDIGKVRINKKLLLKPERLDDDEYEMIKQHSEDGYHILRNNGITNPKILDGVWYHHEKLDGSGYPKGLRGKVIPRSARIIGICDAFDAMTTKRTFRTNYTSFEALLVMKREMTKQFDETYIGAFIQLLRQQ